MAQTSRPRQVSVLALPESTGTPIRFLIGHDPVTDIREIAVASQVPLDPIRPICGDALDVRQVRVGKEITDLACHRVGELWAAGHLDAGDSEKLPLADWKHDVDFILAARRQGGFHAHREVT